MLLPADLDPPRVEEAVAPDPRLIKQLSCPIAERSLQPLADRDIEPLLRPFDECLGQIAAKHSPQEPLALATADFDSGGQAPSEFHQAMIEKRAARLKARCHAGAIELDQNITWQ